MLIRVDETLDTKVGFHIAINVDKCMPGPPVFMNNELFNSIQIGDDLCATYPSGNIYMFEYVHTIYGHSKWSLSFRSKRMITRLQMVVMEAAQ